MSSHTYACIGCHSGIGLEILKQLREKSHHVVAFSRHPELLPDLSPPAQAFEATAPFEGTFPEILDGLVYSVGSITLKPFHRLTAQDFSHDWEVNVGGAIRAIQAALPSLKRAKSPSIVLFSTVASQIGFPFHASIASAKSALEGLALSLAAELAPHIRVNVIAPSLTDTPLASKLLSSEEKRLAAAQRHPLQQIGNPAHIAQLATFLLSPKSSFLTGQIIATDGGLSTIRP